MIMGLIDVLNIIDEGFTESVLPLIKEGKNKMASDEMNNLTLTLNAALKQFAQYHSGIRFVASAELLHDDLKNGTKKYDNRVEEFQTYLAQLKLAVTSKNVY